jgi:hypothetical protein
MGKYQSKTWVQDHMADRTSEPPDTWEFGIGYAFKGCTWVVLHRADMPHTTLVVTASDLKDDFLEVAA